MKRVFGWAGVALAGLICLGVGQEAMAAGPDMANMGQSVAERLIGKPLFLRGFWASDDLKFNAAGEPEASTQTLPFTESGIDVRSVRVEGSRLIIDGQRMALVFLPNDQIRRVAARTPQYSGDVHVEIEGDGTGDYSKALETVFANDLGALTPSLPPYWQNYAAKHFGGQAGAVREDVAATQMQEKAVHVGGEVKPPTLLRTYNPTFTELATAQKFNGDVRLYLWFNSDGTVSHVSVAKPAGLGLDEAAVAAVKKYQFAPATRGGDAVTVDLYLDVNFAMMNQGW